MNLEAPVTLALRGPLFFPVTAFHPDGRLHLDAYRAHVRDGLDAGAGAVFAGCGTGEVWSLGRMRRIGAAVRARHGDGALHYFNGMPPAEMSQPAYRAVGVAAYSSAVFCFAPDLATAFHTAHTTGDDATADRLLDGFWAPYVALRRSGAGYAVSLVKAGVRLAGRDV